MKLYCYNNYRFVITANFWLLVSTYIRKIPILQPLCRELQRKTIYGIVHSGQILQMLCNRNFETKRCCKLRTKKIQSKYEEPFR